MGIKLKNGKSVSEEAIRSLESKLGYSLPSPFRAFVTNNDGAEPETNIFKIDEKNESGINKFIPVHDIADERQRIENLPPKAFPVAWAECGNYVFVDTERNGGVYFWDHEEPERITKLGDAFNAFLSNLQPFDVKAVQLKPG